MNSYRYLKEIYGEKVYKLSLDGGFTCPNRDGTLGYGGCIFCSGSGSGDFAQDSKLSITEQIEKGKSLVSKKMSSSALSAAGSGKYIAYFQAFTGTYAPVIRLRQIYMEAIMHPDIVGISIATRPDCLSDEVIKLIDEINKIKPVWVELGLQTIHEETAEYIRRGYKLSVYDEAVNKLKKINIPQIIVHVIIGLPGENEEMLKDTVKYVVKSSANGIKLQLLHVIKGTDLEKEYCNGNVKELSLCEYVNIVADTLSLLPEDMVVHRMTGDGDKRTLVAPLWSADKKRVLNSLNKAIKEKGIILK